MSNQIIIKEIKPMPFKRPRFNAKTKSVYNDTKYSSYKKLIASKCQNFKKLEGNLSIECNFFFKLPKRQEKGKTYDNPIGDLDNLVKAIKDALEGVSYFNDRQIVKIIASKGYASTNAIFISVKKDNREIEKS